MFTSIAPRAYRAAAVVALAAGLGIGVAAQAEAATGTVHTAGAGLTIRSGPHTGSTAIGSYANGTSITITCQTYGDTVTGRYGTSNIWDHTAKGYVSDTYVYTGSDGFVAPTCGSAPACSTAGLGDPRSCPAAVTWLINHRTTTYHPEYYGMCDHIAGLAYGFSHSGSTTAYVHWTQVPSAYKHPGVRTVPAGGLAFFSTGAGRAGHVMVSIGGGHFISNDIHGSGTLTETTISEVESRWGDLPRLDPALVQDQPLT